MVVASHSIDLLVSKEDVFGFLMKLDNYPLWQAGVSELTATDGFNPGSTIYFHAAGLGRSFDLSAVIVKNDGHSSFSAVSHRGPITFDATYTIIPTKTGCNLRIDNHINTRGVFSVAQPALQSISENRYKSDLNSLKIILESGNYETTSETLASKLVNEIKSKPTDKTAKT